VRGAPSLLITPAGGGEELSSPSFFLFSFFTFYNLVFLIFSKGHAGAAWTSPDKQLGIIFTLIETIKLINRPVVTQFNK
tara:strand:+ start:151 stop:387 length:237 start_codon:yes stop_codon:yes gene_type:complete